MPKKTSSYNSWLLKQLVDPTVAANYLNTTLRDSREMFLVALRKVAESRGMTLVAEEADVSRESLYRMLSEDGNPTFHSLTSVLDTLGLQMEIAPRQSPQMALSAVGQVSASHEITTNELQAPWKEQPGLLERLTPARRSQVARPDIFEYAH